jgi:Cof subfamily protein (haloacid dehalogenase superfamily)
MRIRLLVADVDGTLVTRSKALTQRACQAIAHLRAAGVEFVITSGRPPRGLAMLVGTLRLSSPIAAFNGGVYVTPDLETVVASHTIPRAVALQAVDYLLGQGLDVWVYQGADWFLRDRDAPHVARERNTVRFDPTVIDDLRGVVDSPIKIVGVSDDHPLVARCESELGALLGAEASAARSQLHYLDVTHPEANKGMVVREASRLLKIPLDEIATIGDMFNDVPMLKISGLSIAMGNASADVQRFTRHVSLSNEEEGFAHAVETFILGVPPYQQTPLGLPPRARACLFSLDSALARAGELHAAAWKQLFDPYLQERAHATAQPFVPFDAGRDPYLHFDGKTLPNGVRSFLASRGIELPDNVVNGLIERMWDLLVGLLQHQRASTFAGSKRYIRAARAAGLRTAAVSLSLHCQEILQAAGVSELFDARIDGAVAAAEHLADKPSPDTYLAAARAIGVEADEAVVFEEDPAGVKAARAGHFGYIVGVDRLGHADELRRQGADVIVTDPGDLIETIGVDLAAYGGDAAAAAPPG